MATQVQWRRGTTAQVAAFTGAVGEVVVDTDTWQMSVQDGVTPGGHYTGSATGGTFNNATFTGSMTLSAVNPLQGTATATWTVAGGTYVSPALTGSPTTVTPALTANNTLVPNTSWVRSVIQLSSPLNLPIAATMPLLY